MLNPLELMTKTYTDLRKTNSPPLDGNIFGLDNVRLCQMHIDPFTNCSILEQITNNKCLQQIISLSIFNLFPF